MYVPINYNQSHFIDSPIVVNNAPSPVVHWWVKELNLFEVDKDIFSQEAELPALIINAAQALIKKQYPHVTGLQDVSRGQFLEFDDIGKDGVQILHARECDMTLLYDTVMTCSMCQ